MKRLPSIRVILGRDRQPASQKLPALTKRVFVMEFIAEFILIYPFYAIMFGQRGGISAAGVGILLATWQIVAVISEVPTGILADKMSKKWALVLGKAMQLLAFVCWLAAPNFAGYFVGFVIWGIGEAFTSGAFQAYLYESLPSGKKQGFSKIYARTSSMTMLAYASSYIAAFFIGPSYNLLLWFSILASGIALSVCLSLPNKRNQVEVELRPSILRSAFGAIRSSKPLRYILIGAMIVQGLGAMLFELLPLYYNQVGVSVGNVPLLLAVGSGVTVALFWWLHRAEKQLTKHWVVLIAVGSGLLWLLSSQGTVLAVVGILLFTRLIRMIIVNNESTIQHLANSDSRATIGSLYSFAGKLLSAALIAMAGLFAVNGSIVTPVLTTVAIVAVVLAGYGMLYRRYLSRL